MASRSSLGLTITLLAACGSSEHDVPAESACDPATRVHDEALAQALGDAPACQTNADCVAMEDRAECEGLVEIHGCDLAVHRRVLELYDPIDVGERMCEAAADAVYGCRMSSLCAPHGAAVCRAGECTFAAP